MWMIFEVFIRYWFFSVPLSFFFFFGIIFMYSFLHNRGKVACLFFDTDKSCKLVYRKVDPLGTITIDERKFMVARSRPSMYNKRLRFFPLYILKHDSTKPIDIVKTAEEEEKNVEKEEKILPTTLNDFMNMTTLKSLLTIQGEDKKGLIMFIFVGFIIGFLLAFVLVAMKIIKFT
jgi:hypothetical protein